MVLARTAAAHRWLNDAFAARRVHKRYVAFAAGDLPGTRTVDVPLVEARRGKARPAAPGARGKPSVTRFVATARWRRPPGASPPTRRPRRSPASTPSPRPGPPSSDSRPPAQPGGPDRARRPLDGKRTLRGIADRRARAPASPCTRRASRAHPPRRPRRSRSRSPLPPDLVALAAWLDATRRRQPEGA
ncbi:MAG: hypothetical protein HS111_33175 [Kofleriaceae bacterium]|nr:hypothetical protein [Kofleriaceae bacterium]